MIPDGFSIDPSKTAVSGVALPCVNLSDLDTKVLKHAVRVDVGEKAVVQLYIRPSYPDISPVGYQARWQWCGITNNRCSLQLGSGTEV